MAIALAVLMIVFLFLPILIWWIRNLARIFANRDLHIITDNLGKIFLFSYILAIIFGLFWGLVLANII